jgi:ribosomal protein S12 methylthiotransferase accessory factor
LAKPAKEDQACFKLDSNGCAAGNTLEEAILQGLLELVERDAMALFWYNRVSRPVVPLDPADPFVESVLACHEAHARKVWALDLTNDLGIPVTLAVSADATGGRIATGLGAHLEPRLALSRALSELNQCCPWPDLPSPPTGDQAIARWLNEHTLDTDSYLLPGNPEAERSRKRIVSVFDLRTDILACVEALKSAGLETIVLDLSRPDIPLSVVRVTVPGLRHFWARFAPGRLYEAPVKLGWRDQPLLEAELNPVPYMF